jgi:hypothetical protein
MAYFVILREEGVLDVALLQEDHDVGQDQSVRLKHSASRCLPAHVPTMQQVSAVRDQVLPLCSIEIKNMNKNKGKLSRKTKQNKTN